MKRLVGCVLPLVVLVLARTMAPAAAQSPDQPVLDAPAIGEALRFDLPPSRYVGQTPKLPAEPRFGVAPLKTDSDAETDALAAVSGSLPLWSATATVAGKKYPFRMVGNSPQVKEAQPVTTIQAYLIPVDMVFTDQFNVTFDPTVPDPICSPGGTAAERTVAGPLFHDITFKAKGLSAGAGQYVDLFQRTNFWKFTKPGGLNPGYHVSLKLTQLKTLAVSATRQPPFGFGNCGRVGYIDYIDFDKYLKNSVFPTLPAVVSPKTLPIFLLYNVVLFDGHNAGNCCILGYHGSYKRGTQVQTYSVVEYDTAQAFNNTADVSVMTHEIAEWMDDPYGRNPTPPWGHTGQVSGCQSNLEVGDPLSGRTFPLGSVTMSSNHFTYHLQDLAFVSWFYRQRPSIGWNGYDSFFGNFKTPAAICN